MAHFFSEIGGYMSTAKGIYFFRTLPKTSTISCDEEPLQVIRGSMSWKQPKSGLTARLHSTDSLFICVAKKWNVVNYLKLAIKSRGSKIPTLGQKVCKYCLHRAIWIPRVSVEQGGFGWDRF